MAGSVERDGPSVPPRRAGELIGDLLMGRMAQGVLLGRLVLGWREVVGDKLAEETIPSALEQGELVVGASSPAWGAQVRFLAAEIGKRSNEVLGKDLVQRVRVVVTRR